MGKAKQYLSASVSRVRCNSACKRPLCSSNTKTQSPSGHGANPTAPGSGTDQCYLSTEVFAWLSRIVVRGDDFALAIFEYVAEMPLPVFALRLTNSLAARF